MEFGGSASDSSDTDTEMVKMKNLGTNEKFIEKWTEWQPKTALEKKLVLGIIHRKNHKDVVFEELEGSNANTG